MRRNQFLALCAVTLVGSTVGGYLARTGPTPAMAQYVVPPNSPNQQVRTENVLFIPDGGLRMVTGQNRTIGFIGSTNGAASIALFDQRGRPGVLLSGDGGGQVSLQGQSTSVKLGSGSEAGLQLTFDGRTSTLKLKDGAVLTSSNDGGRFQVNDARGEARLRIDGPAEGGRISGYGRNGVQKFEVKGAAEDGQIDLFGKDGAAGFQAKGNGSASVTAEKKSLWRVPASEGGDGGG
ncbi:MAG: hypothetical protein JST30_07100 [Armatimonadetes bacterium]|nr:hypothetical protein [Armatimonadota bacterium]